MGLLERLDRRNQNVLDFHNHEARTADVKPISTWSIVAGMVGGGIIGEVLVRLLGLGAFVIIAAALGVGFGLLIWQTRQKRLAWQNSKQTGDVWDSSSESS